MILSMTRGGLLAALLWITAPSAMAQQPAVPALPAPSLSNYVQIAPGVHVRHGEVSEMTEANQGGIANIGFIVGNDSVMMIDSGGSLEDGRAALGAIAAATPLPVRYLVNTHMHPDHVFGNAVFSAAGATIVGHRNLPAALDARRDTYLMSMRDQIGPRLVSEVTIVPPAETVADERSIDLGGRTVRLKTWATAHTDNDLTVLDETTGTLFAGDLVFVEHVPVIDGSLKGWLAQMPALRALPAQRVVPGHGPVSAPWPGALDAEEAYLRKLADDIRAMIAKGGTLAEAATTAGRSEAGRWQLFDDYNPRNATAAFAELEWE